MKSISIHSRRSFQGPSINAADRAHQATTKTKRRGKNKAQHAPKKSNTKRTRDHVTTGQQINHKSDDATGRIGRQVNQKKLHQAANQRQIDATLKKLDKQNNQIATTDPKPIKNDSLIEKMPQEATKTAVDTATDAVTLAGDIQKQNNQTVTTDPKPIKNDSLIEKTPQETTKTTVNTATDAVTLAGDIRSSVSKPPTSISASFDQTAKPSINDTPSVEASDPLAIEKPESTSDSSSDSFSHDIFFIGRHTATSVTSLIDDSTKRSVVIKEADSDRKQDFFTFRNQQNKDKDDSKRLPKMFRSSGIKLMSNFYPT